jgi:hypothetical protein
LFQKISRHVENLTADEDHPIQDTEDLDGHLDDDTRVIGPTTSAVAAPQNTGTADEKQHRHSSLKHSVPTCWNSTLEMVESILNLNKAVDAVLKTMGKYEVCLTDDDIELLQELHIFLAPYRKLTVLVSEATPNVSCLPLMVTRIENTLAL